MKNKKYESRRERAESSDKQEKGRTKSEEEADEKNKKQEERLKETKKEWCGGGDKREKRVRTKGRVFHQPRFK
jgi:hypothetical protein